MSTRLLLCLLVLSSLACKRTPAPRPAAPRPAAVAAPSAAPVAHTGHMAGKVLERLDVGEYSYLRLDAHSGEQWAAVKRCTVANGDHVVVSNAVPMDGFESKTLHRKFDHIVFGQLQGTGPEPAASAPPAPPSPSPSPSAGDPHSGMSGHLPAVLVPEPIAVKRATGTGAVTVAELFEKGKALDGKPVVIRAKVVKVLPGIMGKTWLHLRDGSGSAEKRDNDLVVTTQDVATLGSEIVVRGIAHSDRDFGSGYRFAVIVEDAKISR